MKSQIADGQSIGSTTMSSGVVANATEGQDTMKTSTIQTPDSDQSTVLAETGTTSSTQISSSDQPTPPDTAPSDTSSTQTPDSKNSTVAADVSDHASSTNTSTADQSAVAANTTDASITQTSVADHSAESSTSKTASTSEKINVSVTSEASIPDKITNSSANDTSNMDVQNVHQIDKDEKPPGFECKKVGRYPHPSSCTKYYYCWDNDSWAYEFTCPEHRAFDPVTQYCVLNYGVCALAPKCSHNKQIIANPDDKWTFFECKINQFKSNEIELHCRPCANHREFDEKLGYCKLTSVNGEVATDSEELVDSNVQCGERGLMIDYEDDTKYYECVVRSVSKGILKPIRHKCPIYHVFSMFDEKCVPLSVLSKLHSVQTMNATNN